MSKAKVARNAKTKRLAARDQSPPRGKLKLVLRANAPSDDDGPDYSAGWMQIELTSAVLNRTLRLESVRVLEDVFSITDRQGRLKAIWYEDGDREEVTPILNVGHDDCWFELHPGCYDHHGLVTEGAPVDILECLAKGKPLPEGRFELRGDLLLCARDKPGLQTLLEEYDEEHEPASPQETA